MSDHQRRAHIELDVTAGRARAGMVPDDDTPFRILVLGDFSGDRSRAGASHAPLAARRPIAVDRDTVDDVIAQIAPEILLERGADGDVIVRIASIDDFHPDQLYDALPLFKSLRTMRARLADPATFASAARELAASDLTGETGQSAAPSPPRPAPGHVLDAILGEPAPAAEPSEDALQQLIRRAIEPYLVAAADPRQDALLARVDRAMTNAMRGVLHTRAFQAVEAAWRSVWMLTRRLETDEHLEIYLLDVSAAELVADLAPDVPPQESDLWRIIAEGSVEQPGAHPWSLLVGAFTFGWDDADLAVLSRLGTIARRAGAPVVAGAAPRLAGMPAFDTSSDASAWSTNAIDAWEALRASPEAAYIGLAAPRFLARLPYGAGGEECDRFAFEELGETPDHREFLWANAAFACAALLGQSFSAGGWRMRPGSRRELTGLPFVLLRRNGEVQAKPCAEVLLTERASNRLLDCGIMPLASLKDQDAALLVRLQSIAHPVTALAGRWQAAQP
ncbi:MAG TPA: type VI secretion system contractile sheath large subunit [Gemmatimonadaceae bacterium]|nr:type VI secretion system contractile sheath large subunit [Gemmatimonadaceae bacterium]